MHKTDPEVMQWGVGVEKVIKGKKQVSGLELTFKVRFKHNQK